MHNRAGAQHLTERLIAGGSMDSDAGMQRKCFWLLLTLLSLGAFFVPLRWGVVETLVAVVASWWIVYRSGIL